MACDVSPVAMFFIKKKPEERDLTCPISVRPWLKNNFGVIRDQKKRKQITYNCSSFPFCREEKENYKNLCKGFAFLSSLFLLFPQKSNVSWLLKHSPLTLIIFLFHPPASFFASLQFFPSANFLSLFSPSFSFSLSSHSGSISIFL